MVSGGTNRKQSKQTGKQKAPKPKPKKTPAFTGENVPVLSSQGTVINGRWNMLYKMSWENKAVHRRPGAFLAVSKL